MRNESWLTFFAASLTLVVCFTASSAPIPLMSVYQQSLSLTPAEIADSIVCYYLGCILTLVFLARLSNFFGRKPVVLFTLALAIAACALFVVIDSVAILNFARFFQGLGCGLASSAAMAWVVDSAPADRRWMGTVMTAAGPSFGLCLGTFLTGVIIRAGWLTPSSLFIAFIVLMLGVCLLVILSKESVPFGMQTFGSVLIPKITVPRRLWRVFFVASAAFSGCWGIGSFFQGFSATVSEAAFGINSTFLAAVTYLMIQAPNAVAGLVIGKKNAVWTLRLAMSIFFAMGVGIFTSLHFGLTAGFVITLLVLGACNGASCTAALKLLLQDTSLSERAGTIAAVYLMAYIGSGIPNFIVGRFAQTATLTEIGFGYIGWMGLCAGLVIAVLAWIQRSPSEAEKLRFD